MPEGDIIYLPFYFNNCLGQKKKQKHSKIHTVQRIKENLRI